MSKMQFSLAHLLGLMLWLGVACGFFVNLHWRDAVIAMSLITAAIAIASFRQLRGTIMSWSIAATAISYLVCLIVIHYHIAPMIVDNWRDWSFRVFIKLGAGLCAWCLCMGYGLRRHPGIAAITMIAGIGGGVLGWSLVPQNEYYHYRSRPYEPDYLLAIATCTTYGLIVGLWAASFIRLSSRTTDGPDKSSEP